MNELIYSATSHQILIIDDNPTNLDILRTTLESEGYSISVAREGAKGIKLASSTAPDLILLDIMMSGLDGFETCKQLKTDFRTRDIPIIFITGKTGQEDIVHGFKVGAVDYITKPFHQEEVLARVATHLQFRLLIKRNEKLIAELRDANMDLVSSQIRMNAIMDSVPDGIIIIDEQGIIESANPSAERIFGYPDGEILGQNIKTLMPEAYREKHDQKLINYRQTGAATAIGAGRDLMGLRKDGSSFPMELLISSMEIDRRRLFTGLVRDITDRKLSENKLMQAKETAEIANAAKSEFLSRMSHELRTPMNSILGFGQLLAMDPENTLTPKQKINVEHVVKAGDHLLVLINELLDLSRIESGEMVFSLEGVNVNAVLDDLFAIVKPLADEKNINIINRLSDEPEQFIWADVTRFKQVLLNLISNAIKYNNEGGSITLECEKTSTGRVRISIKDTGIGISREKIETVFEPFSRLGMESTVTEGTGIGLTITKRLTELMGGYVEVESTLGEGSCFTVDFPMSQPHERPEKVLPTETSIVKENHEYTVLYVEDNPANRALVSQILLNRPKIKMLSAPQAKIGIELAQAHQPDLILMDINLPGMGGTEALKNLQTHARTRGIPVIAVSANAMEADVKNALAEGFKDYIIKPIDVPDFLNKIDKMCGTL